MRNTLIALILAAFAFVPIAGAAEIKILGKIGHWEVREFEGRCTIEHDGYTVDGKRVASVSLEVYLPSRYLNMPTSQVLVVRGKLPKHTDYVAYRFGDADFESIVLALREYVDIDSKTGKFDIRLPLDDVLRHVDLEHALDIRFKAVELEDVAGLVEFSFDISMLGETLDVFASSHCQASREATWNYENLRKQFGSWSVLRKSGGCYMEQRKGQESVSVTGPYTISGFINAEHESRGASRTYYIEFMDRWDQWIRIDDGPWFYTTWRPGGPFYDQNIGPHAIEVMKLGGELSVFGKRDTPEDQLGSTATFSLSGFKEAFNYMTWLGCS